MINVEKQVNLSEKKKCLRKQMLKIRNEMPQRERQEKSEGIRQKLYQLPDYQKADVIFAYVDYQTEVITTPILEKAITDGKEVYCPRVDGMEMDFYRIMGLEDLAEGYKGIREPLPEAERKYSALRKTEERRVLMLMPGAVFDKDRHRIGYGKGFYDRYLSRMENTGIFVAALAYEKQMVKKIPAEPHDIRPDIIITEENIYGNFLTEKN